MKAYEIREFGIENLVVAERPEPECGSHEVVVRFRAVSVNYRDLMMVRGIYNPRLRMPIVPFSDGAGEVVEVGKDVTRWKTGDRVMPAFMQGWIDGPVEVEKARTALGGDLDGTLREFGAFHEEGLVRIPEHLSFDEAATLPCAALTAFNALFECARLNAGDTVLLLGTGGVSIFALQFAHAARIRTIVTSSSNEKLIRARQLGADETINYREREDWDRAVLEMTAKRGVDAVVEVGGGGTMQRSVNAVKMGGTVAVIGVLSGKGDFNPASVLMKSVKLQGIFVGSRRMFEDMNAMLAGNRTMKPVIDRVFSFGEAREALNRLASGAHFGKIVIRI